MSDLEKIKNACIKIQPYYDELISNYSTAYLSGSPFYVGKNILEWWNTSNNIRYYTKNKYKIIFIIMILKEYNKNKKLYQNNIVK